MYKCVFQLGVSWPVSSTKSLLACMWVTSAVGKFHDPLPLVQKMQALRERNRCRVEAELAGLTGRQSEARCAKR